MQKRILLLAAITLVLSVANPAKAQRTKQWAADWSRCIRHDSGGFHNNCTARMAVYWIDINGGHNQVNIAGGGVYPGGSKPDEIFACLADQGNSFDWTAKRCWYWE